ncbi:hypothetical protein ACFLUP_03995 [Chloroflexota bacterium]
MWRRKKILIIGLLTAVILVSASIGGVALADDATDNPQPGTVFLEKLAEKLGISVEELQAKIAKVREELPQIDCEGSRCRPGPAGHFGNLRNKLGTEIDGEAFKAAMVEAKERILAGEDKQEVMAEVMEQFGIDINALKDKFAENTDGERPFRRGFRGPRDMHRMPFFGDQCTPIAPIE